MVFLKSSQKGEERKAEKEQKQATFFQKFLQERRREITDVFEQHQYARLPVGIASKVG